MRPILQYARKAAQLARKMLSVARSDGPTAAISHTFCYLATRVGIILPREPAPSVAAHQQLVLAFQREVALLRKDLHAVEQELHASQERDRQVAQSLWFLGEHHASTGKHSAAADVFPESSPVVSIIMPVWNRQALVGAAIDSVLNQDYPYWELLVIDDGSTDDSRNVIATRTHDPRVRLLTQDHRGVCPARNVALNEAQGEIVTYLDSDNTWFPQYLTEVVNTFDRQPEADCAYAAQLVEDVSGASHIRCVRFDRDTYPENGGIDLNVFAHRRGLVDQFGGFDEDLTQLVDWELIIRYTRHRNPALIRTIGGRYRAFGADSISRSGRYWQNDYQMRRKHDRPISRDLRVLYVVWDFPQLTETYIRWEIECMQRWGVHVEVWSERDQTTAPYPTSVPVHYGSLKEAIRTAKPHVAHVHWLNVAERYHEQIARTGLHMTVRGHGFEFNSASLPVLLQNQGIQKIYVFPHYLPPQFDSRVEAMTSAFNGNLYFPPPEKDPFLVVRTASGKPTKGIETFIDVATQCPQHRFVLVLGMLNQLEDYVRQIQEYNGQAGSPVEIHVNLPTEEAAALVRQAGIYLHTYGEEEPFGMPISIAEAMATGAFTLVRNRPGAADYVGTVGAVYESADHAASLIRQSVRWYDEQWQDVQRRSVEYAHQRFADARVLRPLLNDWLQICEDGIAASAITKELEDPELQPALRYLIGETGIALLSIFGRTYLSHVVGASRLLGDWGADREVRSAALLHSIYIAKRVDPTPFNRAKVQAAIGVRAERLIYAFCALGFKDIVAAIDQSPALEFLDQLAGGPLRVTPADFKDLCQIHLADWLEKMRRCPEGRLHPQMYRRIAEYIGGSGAAAYFALESTTGPATGHLLRAA